MANGACDICSRPATARVRASVNGRVQNMELCDQHYSEIARRSGRSASPLESLFGRHSLLDEFFGESGFGNLFGDSRLRGGTLGSMGDGDDAVVDATFGEGAPRSTPRRGGGRTIADRLSEQGNKLLQDAAQKAGEFGRSEVDTEHLLLALTPSDVVKTILEQFKVDVDDLRRQIEKEAKRGDAKTEGEISVSPRLKDALNRAFIA
jgi:ATP-dependent Clp protease ATP-binding subunit ClpC